VKVGALVVAAGRGSRMGGGTPKQYLPLGPRPLLRHALARLAAHPRVDVVRTVIHPDDMPLYRDAADGLVLADPVHGGATRQESARNGLERLAEDGVDAVLIHDGARPFVDEALIDRVLDRLETADGALPAIPVSDTLKRVDDDGHIQATVPRHGLWRAQTPQGFRFAAIRDAHAKAAGGPDLTDDAQVAEAAGLTVDVVQGSDDNVKITTQHDRDRALAWLRAQAETRVGQGFDVHAFADAPGPVRLCGVDVPHDQGLAGYSDADVGLHVVVDAILGALGAGDIGQHFPPGDPKWEGADSARFVEHVRDLAANRGAAIVNLDVTLICERPKLGAHRDAMGERIAGLLDIGADRVSVKATTTEKLGFTGRREGIAGQCVACLRVLPNTICAGGNDAG
jgi:2-C-methyl-D-erythritol 4-phosphate cytidylyltransferase/2-C-methyl-D-erythritol 2,4-cyclodiphosphate synthase